MLSPTSAAAPRHAAARREASTTSTAVPRGATAAPLASARLRRAAGGDGLRSPGWSSRGDTDAPGGEPLAVLPWATADTPARPDPAGSRGRRLTIPSRDVEDGGPSPVSSVATAACAQPGRALTRMSCAATGPRASRAGPRPTARAEGRRCAELCCRSAHSPLRALGGSASWIAHRRLSGYADQRQHLQRGTRQASSPSKSAGVGGEGQGRVPGSAAVRGSAPGGRRRSVAWPGWRHRRTWPLREPSPRPCRTEPCRMAVSRPDPDTHPPTRPLRAPGRRSRSASLPSGTTVRGPVAAGPEHRPTRPLREPPRNAPSPAPWPEPPPPSAGHRCQPRVEGFPAGEWAGTV